MKVDKSSFHWRVYAWWYGNKYKHYDVKFTDYVPHSVEVKPVPERSNLCPYMRAVMFWAPLRWFFSWGYIYNVTPVLWAAALFVVAWPILSSHRHAILGAYALVIGIVAELALLIYLLHLLIETNVRDYVVAPVKRVKGSSFWSLLSAYLRSAHDRVCPEVEVE